MNPHRIRFFSEGDLHFILATWLNGIYYGNDWFNEIPKEIFFKNYELLIKNILNRKSIDVRCACLWDDPDVILAYSVIEKSNSGNILHFIFTKAAFRKMGIAKSLVDVPIRYVSQLTKLAKLIKPKEWDFNPFLI